MIRRPPRSTLFPTRRSSDLTIKWCNRRAVSCFSARFPRRLGFAEPVDDEITRSSTKGLFEDRKSTRLNSSHSQISYAVFCLKKKKNKIEPTSKQHTKTLIAS